MQKTANVVKETRSRTAIIIEIVRYAEQGHWVGSAYHFNPERMFDSFFNDERDNFRKLSERASFQSSEFLSQSFENGFSRPTEEMFDALAEITGATDLSALEKMHIATVLFNPRLVSLIDKPSILVQALAVGLDPALIVDLKLFDSEVQFVLLTSRIGSSLFDKFPGAFDLASIEKSHPGITNCVTGEGGKGVGHSLADRLDQFRAFGVVNAETAQMQTVRRNPNAYRRMINPSEAVQRELVQNHPRSILQIDAPSEELMRIAVTIEPAILEKLKSPPQSICQLAANQAPRLFQYVKKPSTELLLKALDVNASNIKFMKGHPELDILVAAAAKSTYLLPALRELVAMGYADEGFFLAAVRQNGDAVQLIKNPSEAVKTAAIEQNPLAIWHFKRPSIDLQILAMRKEPSVFKLIDEPSIAARYLALGHFTGVRAWKTNSVKFQIAAIEKDYPGISGCLEAAKALGLKNPEIAEMVKTFQETHPAEAGLQAQPQSTPGI